MAKTSKIDEKKIAGASYIFNFYKEVEILTDYYAQYINFLLQLKEQTKNTDLSKLGDAEKQTLIEGVQGVRLAAHKIYVQYTSIAGVLKLELSEKIKESYAEIKKHYIIKEDDLEKYVIEINKFLLNQIIQELLEDSQSLIEEVYKDDTGETEGSGGS